MQKRKVSHDKYYKFAKYTEEKYGFLTPTRISRGKRIIGFYWSQYDTNKSYVDLIRRDVVRTFGSSKLITIWWRNPDWRSGTHGGIILKVKR